MVLAAELRSGTDLKSNRYLLVSLGRELYVGPVLNRVSRSGLPESRPGNQDLGGNSLLSDAPRRFIKEMG